MIDLAGLSPWKRRLAAAIAGATATLGFAPFFLFPVALAAFAFLVLALRAEDTRKGALATGFAFGYGHFAVSLHWMAFAFTVGDRFPLAMGAGAVLLLCLPLALYAGLAGLATFAVDRRVPALLFAASWTLLEWLRGILFTGLPWNPLGAIWAVSDATMQGAALFGVFGLSFVTILCAGWLADGLADRRKLAAGIALPVALFTAGTFRLQWQAAPLDGEAVRIVQGNVQQDAKWDPDHVQDNFETYLTLARAMPARGAPPRIQVWPEAAVPYLIDEEPAVRGAIAQGIAADGIVLTGAVRRVDGPDGEIWYNNLFALDGAGRIVGNYDKHHLVPFGEYVPFRPLFDLLGLGPLANTQGDFGTGPGPRTLHLPGVPPVSPLICYEAIFPGEAVDPADRPAWLLTVTNDAWFGQSIGPHQHFALSRFRAVEQGVPLLRAAGTGISGFIDGFGHVRESLGLDKAGVIDARLPGALPPTPYAIWHERPLLIVAFAIFVVTLIRNRRLVK